MGTEAGSARNFIVRRKGGGLVAGRASGGKRSFTAGKLFASNVESF